jgi:hypothetical protein
MINDKFLTYLKLNANKTKKIYLYYSFLIKFKTNIIYCGANYSVKHSPDFVYF